MPKTPKPHGRAQSLRPAPTGWGRLRESHGLSLRELEEVSGISRGTISRIEQSMYPTPEQARQLLATYDKLKTEE